MAKGRTYELAFRIGGLLAPSFGQATGEAAAKLTDLQRKAAQLSARGAALAKFGAVGSAFKGVAVEAGKLALGLGAAAAAAGTGLFALAKSTAAAGDMAIKSAQKLGIDVEALQELWYATERSGGKMEDFNLALRKMSVGLGQAAAGKGEARDWLLRLGVDAAQLAQARPEEAMARLADALKAIPDPAQRAAASQAIFGEGAVKIGVLLDEGSAGMAKLREEARRTGGVLSGKTAKESADFNDRLLDLTMTLGGLRNTVGAALIPAFTELFTKLAAWLQANNGKVRDLAERFGRWATDAVPKIMDLVVELAELAGKIGSATSELAEFLGGWDRLVYLAIAFKSAGVVKSVVDLGIALKGATGPAWGLAKALLANPAVWFAAAIAANIAAIAVLVVYWDEWTGWLAKASTPMKVLVGLLGVLATVLTAPLLPFILLAATVIHYWDDIVAAVAAGAAWVREKVTGAWETITSAVATAFGTIKTIILAAAEVWWMFYGPPIKLAASVVAAVVGAYVWLAGRVVDILSTVAGLVADLARPILSPIWDALVWLLGLATTAWDAFFGWLTGLWATWGDTVKAIIGEVLAAVLNLLTTLPRVGMAVLNALPGQDAPNLVRLREQLTAAAASGASAAGMGLDTSGAIPTLTAQPVGAPLAGATSNRTTTTTTQNLSVSFAPQVTVGGEGGAAAVQAGLKASEDSLLERLQAALEQQQRLSLG